MKVCHVGCHKHLQLQVEWSGCDDPQHVCSVCYIPQHVVDIAIHGDRDVRSLVYVQFEQIVTGTPQSEN